MSRWGTFDAPGPNTYDTILLTSCQNTVTRMRILEISNGGQMTFQCQKESIRLYLSYESERERGVSQQGFNQKRIYRETKTLQSDLLRVACKTRWGFSETMPNGTSERSLSVASTAGSSSSCHTRQIPSSEPVAKCPP